MNTTVMNPVKAFTLIALGLAIAAMGIYVANADDTAPLFPQAQEVPSVIHTAPPPRYAAAADRARELVGWRDVRTRTPVTPDTRFNIGTAWSPEAIGEEGE
jgi:hypothetical protein